MNRLFIMILIKLAVLVILVLVQFTIYREFASYLRARSSPQWIRRTAFVVFTLFAIPLLALPFWRPNLFVLPRWFMTFCVYPFYVWHFSIFVLFLATITGKIFKLPFATFIWIGSRFDRTNKWIKSVRDSQKVQRFDAQRRTFLRRGTTVLAAVTFGGSVYGMAKRDEYEISTVSIPIKNLPNQFNGFTIALLSDIHSSVFMTKEEMKRYAELTNFLGADLIAVTGDFINSSTEEVYPFAEAFVDLKAQYGVYGVLGNHDYFASDVETVAKEVNQCGIRLLRHQRIALEKDGAKVYLLGVDDINNLGRADQVFGKLVEGIEPDSSKILMCHRPYGFTKAAAHNIDLTLSGHTHGGQIVFGKIGNNVIAPARFASQYVAGLYSIGSSQMYISRGVGTVGVPIRINCPPEVTKITLVKA